MAMWHKYDVLSYYDPNISPQWQRASKTERALVRSSKALAKENTAHPFADREKFDNRNIYEPYDMRFAHDNHVNTFLTFEEDINSPLAWNTCSISKDPYKAMWSWQQAFLQFRNASNGEVDINNLFMFHKSSLYLLCLFIPGAVNEPHFNPMHVSSFLFDVLVDTAKSFYILRQVYPPIKSDVQLQIQEKRVSMNPLPIYDAFSSRYSQFKGVSVNRNALYDVFLKHFETNRVAIDNLDDMVDEIILLSRKYNQINYLLPFVCTKLFSCVLATGEEDWPEFLQQYETYNRLFDSHQRKIKDNRRYFAPKDDHPVILFMKDIIGQVVDYPRLEKDEKLHWSETELVAERINTNWLALSLYGNRRFFDDQTICSWFCDLTLPVLLENLFGDISDQENSLETTWLLDLAGIPQMEFESKLHEKLHKMCQEALEQDFKTDGQKHFLGKTVFRTEIWAKNRLKLISRTFSDQVTAINQLINDVEAALKEAEEDPLLACGIVRTDSIRYLFEPIFEFLNDYLEMLFSPVAQRNLFYRIAEY